MEKSVNVSKTRPACWTFRTVLIWSNSMFWFLLAPRICLVKWMCWGEVSHMWRIQCPAVWAYPDVWGSFCGRFILQLRGYSRLLPDISPCCVDPLILNVLLWAKAVGMMYVMAPRQQKLRRPYSVLCQCYCPIFWEEESEWKKREDNSIG